MLMRSHCDLGVGAFRRSVFLSRHSQYLVVFAHPLESLRDRFRYPQRIVLEKRGSNCPFCTPPGYATDHSIMWWMGMCLVMTTKTYTCSSYVLELW